ARQLAHTGTRGAPPAAPGGPRRARLASAGDRARLHAEASARDPVPPRGARARGGPARLRGDADRRSRSAPARPDEAAARGAGGTERGVPRPGRALPPSDRRRRAAPDPAGVPRTARRVRPRCHPRRQAAARDPRADRGRAREDRRGDRGTRRGGGGRRARGSSQPRRLSIRPGTRRSASVNGSEPYVLREVMVFDRSGGFSGPVDIHVEAGRIVRIDRDLTAKGVASIDFSGLWLLPGIFDCHDHITMSTVDMAEILRTPVTQWALEAAQNARRTLEAGITFVRDLSGA